MLVKTTLALALGSLIATAGGAAAEITKQDRQQAACYQDVQRLCGQFIPDTQKTEACMSTKKDKVSAKCRKFYDE